MRTTFKSLGLVALIALLVGCSQNFVSAQNDQKTVPGINGVWQTVVTPRICATGNPVGPTFPGLLMFVQDGTMTGTSTAVTSAYGNWSRETGRGEFSFAAISLKYDASGNFAGTRRISQNVILNEIGDAFTSSGTLQDFDPAGNPTVSGCSTATGSRFN